MRSINRSNYDKKNNTKLLVLVVLADQQDDDETGSSRSEVILVALVFSFWGLESVLVVVFEKVGVVCFGRCIGCRALPLSTAVEVEIADVLFDLDHLFIELPLAGCSLHIQRHWHKIPLKSDLFDVNVRHLVVFARLKIFALVLPRLLPRLEHLLSLRNQQLHQSTDVVIIQKMGNTQYREEELAAYSPPLSSFRLVHSANPLSVYRHLHNAQQIMEYHEIIHTKQNVDRKLQTFYARYQHPYLVSTQYLKVEESDACTEGSYTLRIFYQRAVTNLSKVNDLPFNDSLHCYLVALKGFEILFKSYGYFQVFENMFHICQKGKLKVWCNQHIYKSVPEQYLLGEGNEEDMVIKIISIIDSNTDASSKSFSVRDALMDGNRLTFASAIMNFRRICRQRRFVLSEYIESLENAAQIESLLDIYVPFESHHKHFDTGLTFNPSKTKRGDNHFSTKQLNTTQDHTNRRRSRIFSPERPQSSDSFNSSHRKQQKVNMTISNQNDGFPQFGAKRENKSLQSSRLQQSPQSQISKRPITISYQPEGQPNLSSFRQDTGRVSDLKKKGPKELPKYPEAILYESKVNRVLEESQSGIVRMREIASPHQQTQFTRQNQLISERRQPIPIRYSELPQQHIDFQERPTLTRSRSQNNLYKNPQRVTFSQQKPLASIAQQSIIKVQAPTQSIPYLNPPRIVFNSQQQTSNLKKSSRIISYTPAPQNLTEQHKAPIHFQAQNQPTWISRPQNQKQFMSLAPHRQELLIQPHTPTTTFKKQSQINSYLTANRNTFDYVQRRPNSINRPEENKNILNQASSIPPHHISGSRPASKRDRSQEKQKQVSLKVYESDPKKLIIGNLYLHRNNFLKKQDLKNDKVQLSQLQSKIMMLQSFASNKITTNQFLNNQSHALSNIKWEKGSNSGHDSVTSAFKNDLLQENPSKPNFDQFQLKKNPQLIKQPSSNQEDRYDTLQTDPKLMEIIRQAKRFSKASSTNKTQQKIYDPVSFSSYKQPEPQQYKYFESVPSKGTLEPFKRLEEAKYGDSCNSTLSQHAKKSTETYLTNQPYSYDVNAFKKKVDPYMNKASAITEKWQEQNICSTSHGSTGKNYLQNIDPDILQDMMAYGLDGRKKNK